MADIPDPDRNPNDDKNNTVRSRLSSWNLFLILFQLVIMAGMSNPEPPQIEFHLTDPQSVLLSATTCDISLGNQSGWAWNQKSLAQGRGVDYEFTLCRLEGSYQANWRVSYFGILHFGITRSDLKLTEAQTSAEMADFIGTPVKVPALIEVAHKPKANCRRDDQFISCLIRVPYSDRLIFNIRFDGDKDLPISNLQGLFNDILVKNDAAIMNSPLQ